MVSLHFSEALFIFPLFFFFLLFFQIVSSLLVSFQVCCFFCQLQSADWSPLVNFYFGYCTFQLRNYPLDLFINIIFISLLIVSFDETLLSYFSYFFKHGFSLVLWTFLIAALNLYLHSLTSETSQRQFLLPFPCYMSHPFQFLCMCHNFLLKADHFR